jgi:hypothetical protein
MSIVHKTLHLIPEMAQGVTIRCLAIWICDWQMQGSAEIAEAF